MIVWGSRLFGAVDKVKGAFSVRTKFGHIWYVPLIPLESWLVFEGSSGRSWRGIRLDSICWRSALAAWLRAAMWLLAIASSFLAIPSLVMIASGERAVTQNVMVAVAAEVFMATVSIALLVWSYKSSRASYERAMELVRTYQLGAQFESLVESALGRGAEILQAG